MQLHRGERREFSRFDPDVVSEYIFLGPNNGNYVYLEYVKGVRAKPCFISEVLESPPVQFEGGEARILDGSKPNSIRIVEG